MCLFAEADVAECVKALVSRVVKKVDKEVRWQQSAARGQALALANRQREEKAAAEARRKASGYVRRARDQ